MLCLEKYFKTGKFIKQDFCAITLHTEQYFGVALLKQRYSFCGKINFGVGVPSGIKEMRQESGLAALNRLIAEVIDMFAAAWLVLSGLMYSLHLQTGSFPKPLTAEEEAHYLQLSSQGDLNARYVLIERNLRLVAHIINKS